MPRFSPLTPLAIALLGTAPAAAQETRPLLCDLVIHAERAELEDARLETELARSSVAAFGEVFRLIDGLWKIEAIDRMSFLRAKHDYDAAKLGLERADLLLKRQQALIEQYELVCDRSAAERSKALARAHERYLRADCDQQVKAAEAAKVNLEFRRAYLASILDLRSGDVATRQQVILAELDVELEEHRLADALRRVEKCQGPASDDGVTDGTAGNRSPTNQ